MSSEFEQKSNYIGKTPSIGITQCKLCVNGYIRSHSSKFIPPEIITLCINFFSDIHIMNKIKQSPNGTSFKSDIFCVKHFKFYIDIWPNGYSSTQLGIFNLYLNLVSLSNKISEIEFEFTISIKETNTKWTSDAILSMLDTSIGWRANQLSTKDIQNINSLTIEFTMHNIMNVLDSDGHSLLETYTQYQYPSISTTISHYEWKINNKQLALKISNRYTSPCFKMHNILWYLQFKPNKQINNEHKNKDDEQHLYLNIVSIPPTICNVWMYCVVSLKELNKTYSDILSFENDLASIGWPNDEKYNINKLNKITIKIEMLLIDIYSTNGTPITNKYLNMCNKPLSLSKSQYIESTEMKVNTFSYLWQLPAMLPSKKLLLIAGFFREIMNEYQIIDNEILSLCQMFFIDNTIYSMNDICNVDCGQVFTSPIFNIGYLKWALVMYPNGNKQETEGFVQFFIHLISLSPKIAKISFNYNIELIETNTQLDRTTVFTFDHRSEGWPRAYLNTDIIKHLKQLTFKLDLKIFDIYKIDGTLVTKNELETQYFEKENYIYYKDSFEWVINDKETVIGIKNAQQGDEFCSEFFRLHSFIWYLEFYPLGMSDDSNNMGSVNTHSELYLTMASFPPNVSSVAFKYKLQLKETETCFQSFTQFDTKWMSEGWPTYKLKHKQLQYCNSYTFTLTISMIDIYDINGNAITKDYINKNIINNCIERPISFKSEEYIWRIDNINTINLWKSAVNGCDGFKSDIFMMYGFKFFMECYPNGNNKESIGNFKWYLNLLSLSNKIKRITFYYSILLDETGTNRKSSTWFDHMSYSDGWTNGCLKTDDIKELNSFTFRLNIQLFDVFDSNDTIMENYSIFQSPHSPVICDIPTAEFAWNISSYTSKNKVKYITNAANNCYFESKIFQIYKCKWFLRLYPSGGDDGICDLFLRILTLPKDIGVICIKYELFHYETNTKYSTYTQFEKDDDSEGWPRYKLETEQLKNTNNSLKFQVKMSLIDVYHKQNGYSMTDQFMDDYKQSDVITFPEETYQWKICDSALDKMKHAQNGEIIQSPIFTLCGIKWMQECYPNGANKSSKGFSGWYLNLISFPSNISTIIFQFKIELYNESNDAIVVKAGRTHSVEFNDSTVWWGLKKIQLEMLNEFKELNFNLEVTVLEIFDNNGNKMGNNIKNELLNLSFINNTLTLVDDYIWNIRDLKQITNANNGQYFESDMFTMHGFDWRLRLYPNGIESDQIGEAKLQLYLNELSNDIKSISIQFQFEITETKTLYFNFANFRGDHLCKGWRTSYLRTNQIENVNELTIKVIITVIDMFDEKGNVIPFQLNDNNITDQHVMTRFVSYL